MRPLRLNQTMRRSCHHWHVEGSLGIASQTAIEFFSGDGHSGSGDSDSDVSRRGLGAGPLADPDSD